MKPITTLISSLLFTVLQLWTSCTIAQPPSTKDAQVAGDTVLTQREQILNEVRIGNTGEALNLLERTSPQEAILLKGQFERVHKDFSRGLIGFDDFAIALARIHFSILEWAPAKTTKTDVDAIPRDQIRKLAEAGALEEALQLLLPAMEEDATLMLARIRSTQGYYNRGLVSEEQLDRLKLNLKFGILELVEMK